MPKYILRYQYFHPYDENLDRSDDWIVEASSEDEAIELFREECRYSCYTIIDVFLI